MRRQSQANFQAQFYVDPASGAAHIYNHQVSEQKVIEVLESRARIDRALKGRELRWTGSGRYLPKMTREFSLPQQ